MDDMIPREPPARHVANGMVGVGAVLVFDGKGGVVRDPAVHEQVIDEVTTAVRALGHEVTGVTPSPILGPAGNREFLLHIRSADAG